MTRASRSPIPQFETVDDAFSLLRAQGLRLSAARRNLLIGLFTAHRLVTADELADGLGGAVPPLDLPVVYRNLETLEELGIVRHVHLGHGPSRYAIAAGGPKEYLVCDVCGEVQTVSPSQIDDARAVVLAGVGFTPSFEHFAMRGICAKCLAGTQA